MYAICAIHKNEDLYLEDWIKFHVRQGFDTFFLFDNNEITRPVPGSHHAPCIRTKAWHCDQMTSYNSILADPEFLKQKFCAFIDIDEFLFHPESSLPDALSYYDDQTTGTIHIPWKVFGSSGRKIYSPEPIWERFTHRAKINSLLGKSIIRPGIPGGFIIQDPHVIIPKDKKYQVVKNDNIWINHYYCKSSEEFLLKIKRGQPNNVTVRKMKDFYEIDEYANEIEDTSAIEAFNKMKHEAQLSDR